MNKKSHKGRVFSGVQPTGDLHLGNYLGAVKQFVDLQNQAYETIYCLVDLHAITVWQDPKALRKATRELAATFLACGLNPEQSILFNQSQVASHTEMGWLFNCVARMGWLNRMTQFKDKAGKNKENASVGLFSYPTLMAADILTYHATHVPVGDDQKQHLELTRDIAIKFNNDFTQYGFFPIPEPIIQGAGTRIMSLRDGTKKMSKSDTSEFSRISLTDSAEAIAKKIQKAKTDPLNLPDNIQALEGRPEAKNLLNIYAALKNTSLNKVVEETKGTSFRNFKSKLTDLAVETLSPISNEINNLLNDTNHIDTVLRIGSEKAKNIATPIVESAYEIVGLLSTKK
ncbi:MAG: tryptophan--tRNA ligase [Rhodobacteraceae bacterium]|nr:MAG: tryptophan--tRNA ligase [Paracoccaceae bacterium]|tara:strand:+ start:1259 stop:2287 length:1029 start_codon:yes stop_codon:yes gene_type:complete